MTFTLITHAIIASYIEPNVTLHDTNQDIDSLFALIMNEINKIEKYESNDISYTKMILGILLLMTLFTLKTKIYRGCECCVRRKKRLKSDDVPLENITIQELNYNVTIE